jgi:archaellum biogenesis ATPase FlaH
LDIGKFEWLVDSWILCGDICFIAGKASSFKTTITSHIGFAVSEGKPVFNNYQTKKCNVLYLNEENNRSIMMDIIKRTRRGLELDENSCNIYFSFLENFRFDSKNDLDLNYLIDFIQKHDIKLLVCDSFRRFFIGKENDADTINVIFNKLKYIRNKCEGLTIIVLHHAKKGNDRETDIRDMLRGSSDIVNSADSVIGIDRKHAKPSVKISHIKTRAKVENEEKLIVIEGGEDSAIMYEKEFTPSERIKSKPEICADMILHYCKSNNLEIFSRADLLSINSIYPHDTITKAINILKSENSIEELPSTARRDKKYKIVDFDSIQVPSQDIEEEIENNLNCFLPEKNKKDN